MRSPILFALIILGSGAAASAEPKQEETSGRVSLNEKDVKNSESHRQSSDWVELATPTPAKHGTEFIIVGKDAGSFSKLRIDAAKGRTVVHKVRIFFGDGNTKTVLLDRSLTRNGQRSAVIVLGAPKAIDRVVITTETHTRGMYSVHGSAGGRVVVSR
jgi:hypothetical protein